MAANNRSLQRVEEAVQQVQAELEFLIRRGLPQEIVAELIPLRGKFNRARLVLGFAVLGGGINPTVCALAAGVELLHLASLLQDDLVDRAEYRQGKLAFWVGQGTGTAILLSDWLFSQAYRFFSRGGLHCLERINRMVKKMALCELKQELKIQRGERLSVFGSLRYNCGKTAVFFQNCCQLGFQAANGACGPTEIAGKVGLWWGMAYQLGNDLQDLLVIKTGNATTEQDRQRGLLTLPLLLLLRQRPELVREITMIPQTELLQLMQHNGVVGETLRLRHNCLTKARGYLAKIEANRVWQEMISRWLDRSELTVFPGDLAKS